MNLSCQECAKHSGETLFFGFCKAMFDGSLLVKHGLAKAKK